MIQVHGFTFQTGWNLYRSIIRPSVMKHIGVIRLFFSLSYCLEQNFDPPRAKQKSRLLFRLQSSSQQELWFQKNPDTWEQRLTDSWIKQLRHGTADNSNHWATQKRWYLATSLIHAPPKYCSGNVSSLFERILWSPVCLPMLSWCVWVTEYGSRDRNYMLWLFFTVLFEWHLFFVHCWDITWIQM